MASVLETLRFLTVLPLCIVAQRLMGFGSPVSLVLSYSVACPSDGLGPRSGARLVFPLWAFCQLLSTFERLSQIVPSKTIMGNAAPVLSAPVATSTPEAEMASFFAKANELAELAKGLGPEALRAVFVNASQRADVKSGALSPSDSIAISAVFVSGPEARHIGPATSAARKEFRSRLGTADAVSKDRFPFSAPSRNGMRGITVSYVPRYAPQIKGTDQG